MRKTEFASTFTKCDVPTQTQNPSIGRDTAEIVPQQFLILLSTSEWDLAV